MHYEKVEVRVIKPSDVYKDITAVIWTIRDAPERIVSFDIPAIDDYYIGIHGSIWQRTGGSSDQDWTDSPRFIVKKPLFDASQHVREVWE